MKVLHLCSSYPYTSLYKNLLDKLDKKLVEQIMYVPLNSLHIENKQKLEKPINTSYIFSKPFTKIDRFIYFSKINKIVKDITKKVELSKINIIHAHFLFSNGGAAYELKKKHGIEYIVTVRNTDVNYFLKYGVHLRKRGINILKEAKSIIFLSPAYMDYVIDKYIPNELGKKIKAKSYIIPNGIDEFWLDNTNQNKKGRNDSQKVNLIYVGELNKNKNIHTTIEAIRILKEKGYTIKYDIIGKGTYKKELIKLISNTNTQNEIHFHDYVKNRNELIKFYRGSDIFVMPSYTETFGLTYIEALSQALPVIYSEGQGIDGYFEEGEVGYSVNPNKPEDIVLKVERIISNYNAMYKKSLKVAQKFNWENIADTYIRIYK